MSSMSTMAPLARKENNDLWVLAETLEPLQQANVSANNADEHSDMMVEDFLNSPTVIPPDFSSVLTTPVVVVDPLDNNDAAIVPGFADRTEQITPPDIPGSSSSLASESIKSEDSWSFSPMRFTGVTLFISIVLSYICVLRQARRHRFKIAKGEALSIQMMYLKKREQEIADMKREAASTDRLYYKNLKLASKERPCFFQPGSYRWCFPFPAISEQQESYGTNLSSTFFQNLQDNVEKQKDHEEEVPTNSKKSVESDPWTCQFDECASQLRSPLNDTDNVNDKEVATNRENSTITLPSLVAFSTPSSRKMALLKSVYVPRHNQQDISLPPLLPRVDEESSKAMSCRSLFTPVEPIPPTTIRRRLSSTSSLTEEEHGNKTSSNAGLVQDLFPVVPHVSTTSSSSFSFAEEEEKASSNSEPCRLDGIRVTPTTTRAAPLSLSPPSNISPTATEVESQVVISCQSEDVSTTTYVRPAKGRIAKKRLPPLCSAPPEHFL